MSGRWDGNSKRQQKLPISPVIVLLIVIVFAISVFLTWNALYDSPRQAFAKEKTETLKELCMVKEFYLSGNNWEQCLLVGSKPSDIG